MGLSNLFAEFVILFAEYFNLVAEYFISNPQTTNYTQIFITFTYGFFVCIPFTNIIKCHFEGDQCHKDNTD